MPQNINSLKSNNIQFLGFVVFYQNIIKRFSEYPGKTNKQNRFPVGIL